MLQEVIVAVLVLCAAGFVLHDRAPALSRRLRVAIAVPMVREGRPAWMKRVARWIAPQRASAGSCGSCSGCDPA